MGHTGPLMGKLLTFYIKWHIMLLNKSDKEIFIFKISKIIYLTNLNFDMN